jgi:hypothetical protein
MRDPIRRLLPARSRPPPCSAIHRHLITYHIIFYHAAMHDDAETSPEDALRRWLGEDASTVTAADDETDEGPGRTPRRLAIVLLVLLPWVALALAIAAGDPASPADPPDDATDSPVAVAEHTAADAGRRPAPRTGTEDARSTSDGERTTVGDDDRRPVPAGVGPTALRLVRDAVTRSGARTSALDAAAVERPVRMSDGLWIVRVHAVVLRGDRTRWRSADHEVWAVPIGRRGGHLIGLERPWRVSAAPTRTATTAWRGTTVDAAAARAALGRAGVDVARVEAQRHPTVRTIVRVRTGQGWVWLRTAPRLAVIGSDATVAP